MELFERKKQLEVAQKALVVQITLPPNFQQYSERECVELASSTGATVVEVWRCKTDLPNARIFIGRGQAEELKDFVQQQEIDLLFFNTTLSPSQERNLARTLECRVIDRISLILDIFALRAQTHEGRLQVELAQLKHLSTRLVRGWTHLERQRGGIGLRGPGETQLETDRRLLAVNIKRLNSALEKVQNRRELGRHQRKKQNIPCVALVGYTNAGKSSIFNALCNTDIYATDQLFATLDTTIRRVHLTGVGTCLLIDTVGFIQNLPPDLIAAFRSTLEEAIEADLLLHTIDIADEDRSQKELAVEQTLQDINADTIPTLKVYNKIDLLEDPTEIENTLFFNEKNEQENPLSVAVSAEKKIGLSELNRKIAQMLSGKFIQVEFTLSPNYGAIRAQLFTLGEVLSEDYTQEKPKITMQLSQEIYQTLKQNKKGIEQTKICVP
jgi:GTP-binding protein HflX